MPQVRTILVSTTLAVFAILDPAVAATVGRCEYLFSRTVGASKDSRVGGLSFENRSDLTIYSVKPGQVKNLNPQILEANLASLRKIRESIVDLKIDVDSQKTVVYPMSGYDLATPLALFPKSDTYVLIDNHSLVKRSDIQKFQKSGLQTDFFDRNGAWIRYEQVGRNVFVNLMTALFAHVPNARITQIQLIEDAKANVSLSLRFFDPSVGREKRVFYLVGELGFLEAEARESGDRARAETDAWSRDNQIRNWWDEMLTALAPRTIIVKGSMSALRQTRFDHLLTEREGLIAPVLAKGGVIVEGASNMAPEFDAKWARRLKKSRVRWELTDGDPRFVHPEKVVELTDVAFSYARNVRIGVYAPENSKP